MTQYNNKNLPQGIWIFIPELSMDTTEESLAAFFKETLGGEVSKDRIDLKKKLNTQALAAPTQYAMVSFPDDFFPRLMHRLIGHRLCDHRLICLKAARRKSERIPDAWPPQVEKRANVTLTGNSVLKNARRS